MVVDQLEASRVLPAAAAAAAAATDAQRNEPRMTGSLIQVVKYLQTSSIGSFDSFLRGEWGIVL